MGTVRKKHILVVDNEQHMANSITYVLRMEDYLVSTANHGKEALEIISASIQAEQEIDLIITDLWMPELSGLDLLKELKKLKIKIPALIITATDGKILKKELNQLGCSEYIKKPFDDRNLLEKVGYILQ
jgi:DNA-binding response OmpR family regulator